jgi:Mn-dependent DtxR family transcriptional regulator
MDLLEEKGWIVSARSKSKSVVLTEEGEELARQFLRKYFGNSSAQQM